MAKSRVLAFIVSQFAVCSFRRLFSVLNRVTLQSPSNLVSCLCFPPLWDRPSCCFVCLEMNAAPYDSFSDNSFLSSFASTRKILLTLRLFHPRTYEFRQESSNPFVSSASVQRFLGKPSKINDFSLSSRVRCFIAPDSNTCVSHMSPTQREREKKAY